MKLNFRHLEQIDPWREQESAVTAPVRSGTNLGRTGQKDSPASSAEPSAPNQSLTVACLHELFEAQVELRPTAGALRDDHARWTYAELDARSNQLAHLLRAQGVGPGELVGICLERSAAAIVAVLGVLKAGGAYVPLDPEYPRDWLAHMLADSQVRLLVTRQTCVPQQLTSAVQVVCLDALAKRLTAQSTNKPECGAEPHDPAYVIYTSGSTGESKGVVVEHRSIVYSTQCRLTCYPDPVGRLALFPSLAFDASVAAIFWTLGRRGTLCLPQPGAERDPARLGQWIAEHQITHWLSVPALYRLMLDRPVQPLRSLRTVVLGGEACPPSLVRAHRAALPGAELFNEYGPTEATVWSTVYRCDRERADDLVPIGRPLPDTRLYVLDERRRLVEPGEPGELYIAGPGVARGYWQRPQLTSERFLIDPFSLLPDGRLYRTGDRVRRLGDGNFEFLGRVDNQAKVRGHRVELGQVEAALAAIDGVAQAVVVAQTQGTRVTLVANLVARRDAELSTTDLRDALGQLLPSYMVPSQYVILKELPLTPRGKIDRHALQTGEHNVKNCPGRITAPGDDVERRLLATWEAVFGQAPLGVCDDFFELGGDSLLAAGLFARIEVEFGRALPPETLLERPTVRRLAELLHAPLTIDADSVAVRIRAGRIQPPLFCLPGIGGHVLEFREFSRQLREPHAVYGLRPAGLEDGLEPHDSIEAMAAHAIRQMRNVQPRGPYALVGYSLGGVVAFEMARQLKHAGQGVSLLALLDSRLWSPTAPLSRWQRLRLHWQNLYHGSGRGRWHYLRERGRLLTARVRRGSWHQAEDDVVLGLALSPASRAVAHQHWQAWRKYQPGRYNGDVLLFVAQRQPDIPSAPGNDPTLGWSRWTCGPVDVSLMNATHAEMLRPESSKVLAIAIEARLARAAGSSSQARPR